MNADLPTLPGWARFLRVPGEQQPSGYAEVVAAAAAVKVLQGSAKTGSQFGNLDVQSGPRVTQSDTVSALLKAVCQQEGLGCPESLCAAMSASVLLQSGPWFDLGCTLRVGA